MRESTSDSSSGFTPGGGRTVRVSHNRCEQRAYPRFSVERAAVVFDKAGFLFHLGLGQETFPLVNISQGGVLVHAHRPIPVGGWWTLRIDIPRFREMIKSGGVVRWCAPSIQGDADFYLGVFFVGMESAQRWKLTHMEEMLTSLEYRAKSSTRKEALLSQARTIPAGEPSRAPKA